MRKLIFFILLSGNTWASGPLFQHKETVTDQEFRNVYKDLQSPTIGTGTASTMTITNLIVSSVTVLGAALGKVKQIVSATVTVSSGTTVGAFVNSNLSLSITPGATTSKIFLFASGVLETSDIKAAFISATLARNGTNIGGTNGMSNISSAVGTGFDATLPCSMIFLDSPASTSALTYAVQLKSDGTHTGTWCLANTTCSLVAVEYGQ